MIKAMNAQEKELWMYAAEDATYDTGNQAVFKASDFISAVIIDADNTRLMFWPQDQTRLNFQDVDAPMSYDSITLTHTTDAHIEVMKAVATLMSNPKGGFKVLQDDLGTAYTADGSSGGAARSDLDWGKIASTGTDISVTACTITTI